MRKVPLKGLGLFLFLTAFSPLGASAQLILPAEWAMPGSQLCKDWAKLYPDETVTNNGDGIWTTVSDPIEYPDRWYTGYGEYRAYDGSAFTIVIYGKEDDPEPGGCWSAWVQVIKGDPGATEGSPMRCWSSAECIPKAKRQNLPKIEAAPAPGGGAPGGNGADALSF